MIEQSHAYYRAVFVQPEVELGCLAEAGEALERLAEHYAAGGPLAERAAEDLAELRAGDDYATAVAQRERYLDVTRAYEAMEAETERVYVAVVGENGDYDEAEYNRAIREVYPPTIAKLQAFLDAEGSSPYAKTVKWMLITAKEDLAYAQ